MSLKSFATASAAACALIVGTVGQPVTVRDNSQAPTEFNLYVYGAKESGLGGFTVVQMDGVAYAAFNGTNSTSLSAQELSFKLESSGELAAITTNGTSLLYIPSTSGAIGFTSGARSNTPGVTQDFALYGQMLYHSAADGTIETLWYASPPAADDAQLWSLGWNLADVEGAIPVAVRTTGPGSAQEVE